MPYPLPLTRTEAYLAYKAGVIQQSDLKPSLAVPRNGIDAWLAYWTGLAADYPKREDGTPHILQEEEAYIAYLCGVINEYPEKCLRRVGAYLRYLISARWGRPDHPLNREELYLSLIKTQVIPSGDPSSDITINGTAKAAFADVKVYGDTFQQTYTGKNLLNPLTFVKGRLDNGVVGYQEGTSSLEATATDITFTTIANFRGITSDYVPVVGGSQYIQNQQLTVDNNTGGEIAQYDSSKTFIRQDSITTGSVLTMQATTAYIRIYYFARNAGTITLHEPQLEAGSQATSFEPYTGGQPSPNPDYPQPIKTVTGLQTVEVQGKNLFRAKDGQYRDSTLTVDVENGRIHVYGHPHASYDQNIWIPVEDIHADGTYTLTMNYSGFGGGAFRLTKDKSYKAANNFGGTYYAPNRGTPVTASATDITYNWILIYLGHGNTQNEVDYYINPQFESGSSSTDFTPYSHQILPLDLGTIELNNLDDTYVDYIWEDMGDWKVRKTTNSVIFKGDGVFGKSGNSDNNSFYYALNANRDDFLFADIDTSAIPGSTTSMQGKLWCEYFKAKATQYIITTSLIGCGFDIVSSTNIEFRLGFGIDSDITDTTKLHAWLLQKRPKVIYPIATPTDTVITDQNLIDQLNALKQGGAEEGTTYIKVSATDPNLPAKLYVEAPKYD